MPGCSGAAIIITFQESIEIGSGNLLVRDAKSDAVLSSLKVNEDYIDCESDQRMILGIDEFFVDNGNPINTVFYNYTNETIDTEFYLEFESGALVNANTNIACKTLSTKGYWSASTYPAQVWSIANFSDNLIPLSLYQKLYGPLKAKILYSIDDGSKGRCFGMAATAGNITVDLPNYTSFVSEGKKSLFSGATLDSYSSAVSMSGLEYINLSHILQYSTDIQSERKKSENNLNGLRDAVKKYINGEGNPVVIGIYKKSDDKLSGHAVLATNITEDSTVTKIQVYDCNYPTHNVILYLYKNGGEYTSWEIKNHSMSNNYISEYSYKINYTVNGTLAYYLAKELEKSNVGNEINVCDDEYALLSCTAPDFEITSDEGESVEIKDSELANENSSEICIPIIPMSGKSDLTGSGLYWVDHDCTISCDASTVEPVTTELAGDNIMISTTVTSMSDLHVNVDESGYNGSASIESKEPSETSVTVSQMIEDEVMSVTASETSGNIKAISGTNQITFQGIEDGKIDINFHGNEKSIIISDDTIKSVCVSFEKSDNTYDFSVAGQSDKEDMPDRIFSDFSMKDEELIYHVTFDQNYPVGESNTFEQSVKSGNVIHRPGDPKLTGYAFRGWTLDTAGKEIYTFDTPVNESFTLYAQWKQVETSLGNFTDDIPSGSEDDEDIASLSFTDVPSGTWYEKAVISVAEQGFVCGYGNGKFGPIDAVTRAQFAQILYNINTDLSGLMDSSFVDAKETSWYYTAVSWAAAAGVVNGMGNGKFEPNEEITREQLVVMLYNFAKAIGDEGVTSGDLSKFADSKNVSSWANEAMQWAVANGLMNGSKTANGMKLNPKDTATRAEIATVLVNFVEYLK